MLVSHIFSPPLPNLIVFCSLKGFLKVCLLAALVGVMSVGRCSVFGVRPSNEFAAALECVSVSFVEDSFSAGVQCPLKFITCAYDISSQQLSKVLSADPPIWAICGSACFLVSV